MGSHLAKAILAVALFVVLFACVPTANAQVHGLYVPRMNATKSAPPEAGLAYAVIVMIPMAVMPLTRITFGKMAGAAPIADSYYAPVVLGLRSDRQDTAHTIYFTFTGRCRLAQPVPSECTSSGTNVIVSATIRF